MTSLLILVVTACVVGGVVIVHSMRCGFRRQDRYVWRFNERIDRRFEDLCWDLFRQEAFEQAMGFAIARADQRFLAMLGFVLEPPTFEGVELVL